MTERKAIVVAGGAGAMGRITVRDLVETAADDVDVIIADYDLAAAKKLAKTFKTRDVRPVRIDIHNPGNIRAGSARKVPRRCASQRRPSSCALRSTGE